MSWLRRFRSWLAKLLSPATRIEMTPEGECKHNISPAKIMEQLDRSAHDPLRRMEIYASVCEACRLAVQEEYVFDKAGGTLAQVDEEFYAAGFEHRPVGQLNRVPGLAEFLTGRQCPETVKQLICGHTICVEEYARRLKLCYDAGDSDQLNRTLSEIFCPDCLIEVLKAVFQRSPQITEYNWRPEWERQLHRIQNEHGQ